MDEYLNKYPKTISYKTETALTTLLLLIVFFSDCSFLCVLTEGQLYFLVFSDKVSKLYIINNMILWCEKLNSTNKKNIVKDIKTWHFHLTRILWDITSEPRNNLLTNIFYWNLIENILIYIYIPMSVLLSISCLHTTNAELPRPSLKPCAPFQQYPTDNQLNYHWLLVEVLILTGHWALFLVADKSRLGELLFIIGPLFSVH